MKTIKIGKYEWYLAKELADKTILFATENIVEGYFDDNSNNYAESKANAFLTTIFLKNLTSPNFDVNKIVNGIWLLTSIQYENYIKPLNLPITAPFLLRTPGNSENTIKCVVMNGEIIDVGIKEKAGIRPCFMLDTSYVNELINNQTIPENQQKKDNVSEINTKETSESSIIPKKEDNNENPVLASTERQKIENRMKIPVSASNTSVNNNQNNNQNNIQNKDNYNSQGSQKNNQEVQKFNQNSQNNKKQKNKKKKAKNKKIETVKPVAKNKVDINSVYEVDNDELNTLASVDFSNEETNEVEVATVKDVSKNKIEESPSVDIQQINEPISDNIKENIEQFKKEDNEEINKNEKGITTIIENNSSEISKKTTIEPEESKDSIDVDIVEIETLPEITTEPSQKILDIVSDETKPKTPFPFVKKPNKNKDNTSKKINKPNNETFVSTTQQNAKKGQSVIMNKLGAIDNSDKPIENEMSVAISSYTSGSSNNAIVKQSQPSSYSQNMSEINQFTIDQLRDILIKRNKQITKLKLSLIEVTAEHEAMLENIAKSKTEIENYKTEIESLNNQIEQIKKLASKYEVSASEEKEELLVQHKKNVEKLTAQLNDATNNLNEAKTNLSSFAEKNKELSAKVQELLSTLTAKEKEIEEYKKIIEEQKTILNNSKKETLLNEKISEMTREKENLLSENTQLTEQLTMANNVIDQLRKDIDNNIPVSDDKNVIPQEVQKLTNEMTAMKADMVKTLRIAKKLKEDLNAETEKVITQASTIKELTEKLNQMHSENTNLKNDIDGLKSALSESHNKVITTEEKLKHSSAKVEELQEVVGNNTLTMHDMAAEISNLRKQNKALTEEVSKADTLTKALLSSDKEKEEKIKELTEKLKDSEKEKDTISEYKNTITELQKKLAEKNDIIEEKDNIINERDKIIKDLSDNINSSYDDLSDFKKLIFEE